MTFDHVSSEGDTYDLWGVFRRLVNQGAWKRPQESTSVARRCYTRDGIVHVQSEELTLEDHLKLACVASVPVRKKSSQTIFRKQAARKLGREIKGTLARRPPIFEKPVRPRTGASDWCGIVTMIVMMCGVLSKRKGESGFSSIIVISPLQSTIRDQVIEVNSMGMTACDLNENLDCLDDIHQGKFNIIYASAEAALDKRFLNSLKAKDSLFNKTLAALIVDESHTLETWTGLR